MARLRSIPFLLCAGFLLLAGSVSAQAQSPSGSSPKDPKPVIPQVAGEAEFAKRKAMDESVWAREVEAQAFEEYIADFWDRLRGASDKFEIVRSVAFEEIQLGGEGPAAPLENSVASMQTTGPTRKMNLADWTTRLGEWERAGYRLVQSEWHHSRFERRDDGSAHSEVSATLHVANQSRNERLQIKGKLLVDWSKDKDGQGRHLPARIDASDLTVLSRTGASGFEEVFRFDARSVTGGPLDNDPKALDRTFGALLVEDLDADGIPEILLTGRNLLLRRDADGAYVASALCEHPLASSQTGILIDVTGDGKRDLILAGKSVLSPQLYRADSDGAFTSAPVSMVDPPIEVPLANCITAGDVDGDGDTDLWLAQYLPMYVKGQMPTPYYDANDGAPSYLLLNDGDGHFTDGTVESGLAAKRYRRTYGSSFIDLDEDGDLDLLVTSDFAGTDVHMNNGSGVFRDATSDLRTDTANFGMSHTFGDYNLDGHLDFYVTGMGSTTARRLASLGLTREDFPQHGEMRVRMGYGNRMFLGTGNGSYVEPPFKDHINRTGWAWGSSSFDFDNDGDRDIFVANGHISGKSSKDYCTRFWCHDIYTGASDPDPVLETVFNQIIDSKLNLEDGISWNGYEKNVLLMNMDGEDFTNIGFLMGVAGAMDSRHVVATDLDQDGRVDLLVVEHVRDWNHAKARHQVLHVFRNVYETDHRWIGVRVGDAPGVSAVGARITLTTAAGTQIARIVNGDSFNSQHPTQVHFGLGPADEVDSVEVTWPGGGTQRLDKPRIDTYHDVSLQASESASTE